MKIPKVTRLLLGATALVLAACTENDAAPAATPASTVAQAPAVVGAAGNIVRMKIDGVEWSADRDYFCAVHPPGYDRAVIVGASLGPKDSNEQAFNLLIGAIDAPGSVHLSGPLSPTQAIQLANLDPSRYLNGGALGFDVRLDLLAMVRDPVTVEARFEGTLNSSNGGVLKISEGYLRCTE